MILSAVLTMLFCLCCNVSGYSEEERKPLQWGEWSYFVVDGEVYICGYSGTDREITIPSEIEGKKVTAVCTLLNDNIFSPFFKAEIPQTISVTIPEGVTELSRQCLARSDKLENVALPSTLERIGDCAFGYCPNLTRIDIPESVRWIGERAFCGSGISSLTLHDGLEGIGEEAFAKMPITEITVPDSVKYMGRGVFSKCKNLTSATLSSGLTHIEPRLFEDCSSLKTAVFPSGIKNIKYEVFSGCRELESIYYPETAESIGEIVFTGQLLPNLKDIFFEGTEIRFKEITAGQIYNSEHLTVTYHYNHPLPSKKTSFSPNPLTVAFMAISALLLCAFVITLILCIRLKKLKTPPKYNNSFAPDVLGSWECPKCGTVNGSLGEYCYKCGKRRSGAGSRS